MTKDSDGNLGLLHKPLGKLRIRASIRKIAAVLSAESERDTAECPGPKVSADMKEDGLGSLDYKEFGWNTLCSLFILLNKFSYIN